MPSDEELDLRAKLRIEIQNMYANPFRVPVEVEFVFYRDSQRRVSLSGMTHLYTTCLVPVLISDVGLISSVTSKLLYDEKNARLEVTVRPTTNIDTFGRTPVSGNNPGSTEG